MSVKWRLSFKSQNGTDCRVDVYDNDWPEQAAAINLIGASDPFYYEEEDSDDLLNDVLRYRTGYIRIIEYNYGARDDIFPTSTFGRYVEFYYGQHLEFNGYIQMQDFSRDLAPGPRVLELPVISPLGLYDKLKINTITPPTTVAIGSVLNTILAGRYNKVITPDISGIGLWQKIYSLVVSPWNEDYHHSMNVGAESKVMEPVTRAYLIEAICKAYGWICHDTPQALVFTSFDYTGRYISYPVGHIGEVDYRQEESITQGPYALTDYYTPADNKAQQSILLPHTGIEVKYEGHLGHLDFSFDRTYFYDVVTMPGQPPHERYSLCNLIPIASLYEVRNVSTATFDQDGKVTIGSFVVAWNGHIGVLVSIGSYPSGHELFKIRLYSRNSSTGFWDVTYKGMKSDYSIAALKEEDNIVDGYIQTTKTITEDYTEVAFIYNHGGTVYPMLPNNTLIFIHDIKFELIEDNLPYAEYRFMPASDSDTLPSSVPYPPISGSITMPISLYRLNDRLIGDAVRSTKVTEYPYLFQQRVESIGKFRAAVSQAPDMLHTRLFTYINKTWRIIAQAFHPWDDEYRLALQHSPILENE